MDFPFVRPEFSGEQAEKGGFARAVAPEDAHPLPGGDFQAQPVQEGFPHGKGLDQAPYDDICHWESTFP